MARIDDRWAEHRKELEDAAHAAGIDPRVMVKIAGFESGFNPEARPVAITHPENNTVKQFDGTMAISSAYGYGQFLNGTWQQMINTYGEKYGVENAADLTRTQANAPELRQDTRLQAAMLAEFTRENIVRAAEYGGKDVAANVYAMHNLGTGDGPKFLQAVHDNPDGKVNSVLSAAVIKGNSSLYGDGNITNAQAYAAMGRKMDQYAVYADSVGNSLSDRTPTETIQRTAVKQSGEGAPSRHHAGFSSHDGHLEQGERGQSVKQLQSQLAQLGATGRDGKPLQADGDFGGNTMHAVQHFQREHGLQVDGVVGQRTQAALGQALSQHTAKHAEQSALQAAPAGIPLLSDPRHPDNAMYNGAVSKLEVLGERGGFANRQELQQAAGQIVFEAKVSGMQRIDHVVPNKSGDGFFAVQGEMTDPAMQRVFVDRAQAQNQPLEHSSRQAVEESQRQSQQTQVQEADTRSRTL
ncbi:peptidoglycan hydrolase-like protein with peptidoglycan-binding domain [Xanthomonas arboricola]|uniref:peptidoglycan-binding protein n=1 Tax=Xanthomonas TaxID=338 RepID=UPI0017C2C6AB|nr:MULTISPECIES: peptidoglycan-binding protein [Xanthomonas]MBB5735446.1 peptidoglycan hydrolase-like protein with peptidoglycan-binding domain [Xanthomonas sp. CFBP 8152]